VVYRSDIFVAFGSALRDLLSPGFVYGLTASLAVALVRFGTVCDASYFLGVSVWGFLCGFTPIVNSIDLPVLVAWLMPLIPGSRYLAWLSVDEAGRSIFICHFDKVEIILVVAGCEASSKMTLEIFLLTPD